MPCRLAKDGINQARGACYARTLNQFHRLVNGGGSWNPSEISKLIETDSKRNQHLRVQSLDGALAVAVDEIVERRSQSKHAQDNFMRERAILARQFQFAGRGNQGRGVSTLRLDAE